MNYMAKQGKNDFKEVRRLSEAIGDFIEYWGFRRIQGQIWTQIFVSNRPLSGSDLTQRLKVSKALVSPALKQMLQYELIFEVKSVDSRKKLYKANPDYLSVIKNVLEKREVPMLQNVQNKFLSLQDETESSAKLKSELDLTKVQALGLMVSQANLALSLFSQINSFDEIEQLVRIYQMQASIEN